MMRDIKEVKTRAEARQVAIDWQNWQSKHSLSYGDLAEWHNYFKTLAKKFDLEEEFKENCII